MFTAAGYLCGGDIFSFVQTSATTGTIDLEVTGPIGGLDGIHHVVVADGPVSFTASDPGTNVPASISFSGPVGSIWGELGTTSYEFVNFADPDLPGYYNVLEMTYQGNGGDGFFVFLDEPGQIQLCPYNPGGCPVYADGTTVTLPYFSCCYSDQQSITVSFSDQVDAPEPGTGGLLMAIGAMGACGLMRRSNILAANETHISSVPDGPDGLRSGAGS